MVNGLVNGMVTGPVERRGEGMAKKLEIDWTRCDGHGLCATLLPEDLVLDEWGFPVLRGREISADEVPRARQAVLACPALALRLTRAAKR
jgi:ferredoxin